MAVARRVGEDLDVPVFLYGEIGGGRRPVFFRRGGPEELQRRIDAGELTPAFGPRRLDPRSGAVLVGVRAPLLAFNLELLGTLETAEHVAVAVRESAGGLPGVQALGLRLRGRLGAGVDERHRSDGHLAACDGRPHRRRGAGEGNAGGAWRARRAHSGGERRRRGRGSWCVAAARRSRRADRGCARGSRASASPRPPRRESRARVAHRRGLSQARSLEVGRSGAGVAAVPTACGGSRAVRHDRVDGATVVTKSAHARHTPARVDAIA